MYILLLVSWITKHDKVCLKILSWWMHWHWHNHFYFDFIISVLFTRSLGVCRWYSQDISILPHSFGCLLRVRIFTLTNFDWSSHFVTSSSGLFLFVQVIATFSVEDSRMKFRHYFLIGWGKRASWKLRKSPPSNGTRSYFDTIYYIMLEWMWCSRASADSCLYLGRFYPEQSFGGETKDASK